jgi:hypothetical protein
LVKIKKNLSDSDMLKGWQEESTFETEILEEETVARPVKTTKKDAAEDINSAYLTPELKESVGKALLELKLNLYKQGIVDYQVKVACQDNQVILTAVPAKVKVKTEPGGKQPVHRKGK